MPFRCVPYSHLSQHPPLSLSDMQSLHQGCKPISKILNGPAADLSSWEKKVCFEERGHKTRGQSTLYGAIIIFPLNVLFFLSLVLILSICIFYEISLLYLVMTIVVNIFFSHIHVVKSAVCYCSYLFCSGHVASVNWRVSVIHKYLLHT